MTIPYAGMFSSCPASWEIAPLQEHVFFQEGPGILAKDFHPEGIPLLRLAGLGSKFATLDGCNFLDPELVMKKWSHFRLEKGDVVTSTSASFGRTSVIDEVAEGAVPYTGIIKFRPKSSKINRDFIGLFLRSSYFEEQASSFAAGSVISHFGPTHLKQMAIALPPIDEQKVISAVINSLDDKIDLLHRQNKTLEAMAETLFRQWFVEEAQEDWEEMRLGDFFPVVTGKKDANFSTDDGEYPFFTCSQAAIKASSFSFDGAAILLAGNGDFNVKRYIGKFEAYQRTYVLIPYDIKYFSFLFTLMRYYLSDITGGHQGSVINFITKGMITDFTFSMPKDRGLISEKLEQFNEIYEKVDSNTQQIRTLEKLRGNLLPKLMSGEVRVEY